MAFLPGELLDEVERSLLRLFPAQPKNVRQWIAAVISAADESGIFIVDGNDAAALSVNYDMADLKKAAGLGDAS